MFSVILDYYNKIWNNSDLNFLQEVFDKNITISFTALDKANDGFTRSGFNNVQKTYQDWDLLADRLKTKVLSFYVKDLKNGSYRVKYEIEQTHKFKLSPNDSQKYRFKVKDELKLVTKNNGRIYIKQIDALRYSKKDLNKDI